MAILAFALLLSTAAAWQPVADTPYRELSSSRKTFSSSPVIDQWQHLCFNNATALAYSGKSDSGAAVYLAAAGSSLYAYVDGGACNQVYTAAEPISALLVSQQSSGQATLISAAHATVLTCDTAKLSCSVAATSSFAFGAVHRAKQYNDVIYVAGEQGAFAVSMSASASDVSIHIDTFTTTPSLAIAQCPTGDVFIGNNSTLTQYQRGQPVAWEWVTDLITQEGGVYDGPIRDLDCDSNAYLFLATAVALNIRRPDGVALRVDFADGMPLNDSTHVLVEAESGAVWIGAPLGLMRWSRGKDVDDWRFFHGARFLPLTSNVTFLAAGAPNETLVMTESGAAHLRWQWQTLAAKAAMYESVALRRHDRHGMVDQASLSSFGNISSASTGPSDNNGLWTSLIVAAETFAYDLAPSAERAKLLSTFFSGMQLLVNVTGVRGLMARTCVAPGEPYTPDEHWHKSTDPTLEGWTFKCDASSDEVVGHLFAYPAMAQLLPANMSAPALKLMEDIMTYIVANDYYLIDVTGNHTQWGVWNPAVIDYVRSWSDERGLNSMQILSFIHAARAWTKDTSIQQMMDRAIDELTNVTNHYGENMLNLKILSPDDNNYSDDELTFLPYYTFGMALKQLGRQDTPLYKQYMSSLERTWQAVRGLRSAPWNAIYLALGGESASQADVESILWNLRTWPEELIDWPVANTLRRDLRINPEEERNGHPSGNAALRILPAYERVQLRWNGNPHELDGGSGRVEGDPGAWLMPYWLARHAGIIV